MGKETTVVYWHIAVQRIGWNRWRVIFDILKLMNDLEDVMSMYNDIVWRDKENERVCLGNALVMATYAREVLCRQLAIPRTRIRVEVECDTHCQAWRRMGQSCRTHDEEPPRKWTPGFCATSALNRGQLKSKGGGKSSIHFCADTVLSKSFFALLFRSVSSVFTEQSQICVKNSLLH